MRYLLDTHILLWWITENDKLSKKARDIVSNADGDIAYSAACVWELGLKHALGRLELPPNFLQRLSYEPFSCISIDAAHVWAASHLPFIHHDPFDRLLIAQSQLESRTLLTVDRTLLDYGEHIELV